LAAFGETSISACNYSHSSQATATLGNTPNLNKGSYDAKHYIGSQTNETYTKGTIRPSASRQLCHCSKYAKY